MEYNIINDSKYKFINGNIKRDDSIVEYGAGNIHQSCYKIITNTEYTLIEADQSKIKSYPRNTNIICKKITPTNFDEFPDGNICLFLNIMRLLVKNQQKDAPYVLDMLYEKYDKCFFQTKIDNIKLSTGIQLTNIKNIINTSKWKVCKINMNLLAPQSERIENYTKPILCLEKY